VLCLLDGSSEPEPGSPHRADDDHLNTSASP
jgi:hypothetical protein